MLKEVERLARRGFALHWLHPRQKRPIGDDWSSKPVMSIEKLRSSYRDGNNVGVRLGKWSVVADHFLHVIDMDVRDPELADEAFDTLQGLFPSLDFEQVPTVKSGSGGASRHFYVLCDQPFSSKKLAHSEEFNLVWDDARGRDVKRWKWEIELFGTGKQVVLPPSIHPDTGKPYRWLRQMNFDNLAIGIGPILSVDSLSGITNDGRFDPDATDDERQKPIGLSHEEIAHILKVLPFDDYCEDRDGWLHVGMALHHETGGSDEGLELWKQFSKRSDKYDIADLKRVWRSFKGKPRPIRMASLAAVARDVELEEETLNLDESDETEADEIDDEEILDLGDIDESEGVPERERKLRKENVEVELGKKVPKRVAALNAKHAVARVSSKTVIMDFHEDGSVTYGSVSDLHAFYENDRVATDQATEPVTKAWMRHKQRRTYPNGIVFAPGREVKGAYNHWQGFAVEPDPTKSCKLILRHIRRHLCCGDETNARYLIGWLAHMIQKPEEKPGVAVVIRGKKGIGKDTLGEYVGSLFPHNYVQVQNQDQMIGKFNAHQEKCLMLHVEEGYWAGNRGADGALKFLITSTRVMIEPKGMNAFPVASVLRLYMSSNEEWVVPATADERRYFVLDADESLKGDIAYFRALRHEMNNGGREALLCYLKNYDLSEFEVRAVPKTAALADQKSRGLRNFPLWWFQMLQEGELDTELQGDVEEGWSEHGVKVSREDFRDAYTRWLRTRRFDGDPWTPVQIGRALKDIAPDLHASRLRVDGALRWFYVVPRLHIARKNFEKWIGSKMEWGDHLLDPITDGDEE